MLYNSHATPTMPNPKVILITGASSGIGEATAIRLVRAGYTVYGGARRVERKKSLEEQGIHVLKLDVTDDASMVGCVERIMSEQGRIDASSTMRGMGHSAPLRMCRCQRRSHSSRSISSSSHE